MDFRRLEAFCNVYELKSFSKAGQNLFLSQPTISAHVAALEKELGVLLFDRLGRMILPTPAGEILYKYAVEAFGSLKSAKAEIQLLQDKIAGDLVIGGSTIPSYHFLPGLMARFMEQYPDVRLSLQVGDSEEVMARVQSGDLALGVVGAKNDSPELVFTPLVQDELVVVAAPHLLNGSGRSVEPAQLAELPWVMREKGSGTRKALEQSLAEAGLEFSSLRVSVNVDSTHTALQFVKAGLGLTITSRMAASELIESGVLVEIEVKGLSLQRNLYSVYHGQRHYFPSARYLISFLENESRKEKQAVAI